MRRHYGVCKFFFMLRANDDIIKFHEIATLKNTGNNFHVTEK